MSRSAKEIALMDTKDRIKELMNERGWTIYELAKRSGLAQTTLSNMWKRNTEPTIPSLRAICDGFGINACSVLRRRGNGPTFSDIPLLCNVPPNERR